MEFKEFVKRAKEIKEVNAKLAAGRNSKPWTLAERTQGFVGDVGDLVKLVMAKNDFRNYDDLDDKLAHELADCLWSILAIADDMGIDLEKSYFETMDEIEARLNK